MHIIKAIKNRRSIRKYTKKKPDWRDIIECIDLARYAPMAGDNFTLKFIVVDDSKTIQKLATAAQQDFVGTAEYVVVACTDSKRTVNAYKERGEMYCRQQAGAAIQNFLLAIEEKKLSTCWIGHFVDSLVKEALKIPKDIHVEAMFPIGYDGERKKTRDSKIDIDNILRFHDYKTKRMKQPKNEMDV